jgi:HprK-related kinase A
MRHELRLKVGPVTFRIGSAWPRPLRAMRSLYSDYPDASAEAADYTVRLEPAKPWRRWLRPSVAIGGDYVLPDAAPLPLAHGPIAAEMAMNLQLALGERRFLLLHAASVEKEGRAVVITGESGAGKSTLSAMLGERGWRFLGDEFALLEPETGLLHPFPRPISLKNEAIGAMEAMVPAPRFGPAMEGTPKGRIRHMRPATEALARMGEPARPALILFPRFGHRREIRPVGPAEAFMRLTQASTNYVALGGAGFDSLTGLVGKCPAMAMDYPDAATAFALIDVLWAGLER